MKLEQQIFKVISQTMGIPFECINLESSPDTVQSWDSVKHMNLILGLEQEFNIQFSDEQVVEMLNVELICIEVNSVLESRT